MLSNGYNFIKRVGVISLRALESKTNRLPTAKLRNNGKLKVQLGYYAMFIVPALWMLLFSYVPMAGLYLAFVDYKPAKGIFGSEFVGLEHFLRFVKSPDFERVFRNTIMYNVGRIVIVNIVFGMLFALLLYEIKSRVGNKIFHTCMLLPAFLSWTVVSAALLVFLHPDNGVLNSFLESIGLHSINWYMNKEYWPFIINFCMVYKGAGMASIYFYAALLSIDPKLFDAASIDGASRLKQIRHISIPSMGKVFCITLITQLGSVLTSSVSPFYELTYDNGALYDTTQVIGTYIYNGLGGGRYSFMTAVSLVQSLIGLALVLVSNAVVKRVDPDSAMF